MAADGFSGKVRRMFATVLALATSLLVAMPQQPAATATTDPSADLSVEFGAHALILTIAFFDISVTNAGPDTAESATVVLTVGQGFSSSSVPANCSADTVQGTITCAFGPIPAHSTATVTPNAWLKNIHQGTGHFTTTAAITASTPLDPYPGNDSVTKQCSYFFQPIPPSPPYSILDGRVQLTLMASRKRCQEGSGRCAIS
jgi:hypothetical protein